MGAISQEPIELEEIGEFLVANLTKLSTLKEEIRKQALKELNTKRSLIRETAITVKVKKSTSQIVAKALEELFINF